MSYQKQRLEKLEQARPMELPLPENDFYKWWALTMYWSCGIDRADPEGNVIPRESAEQYRVEHGLTDVQFNTLPPRRDPWNQAVELDAMPEDDRLFYLANRDKAIAAWKLMAGVE